MATKFWQLEFEERCEMISENLRGLKAENVEYLSTLDSKDFNKMIETYRNKKLNEEITSNLFAESNGTYIEVSHISKITNISKLFSPESNGKYIKLYRGRYVFRIGVNKTFFWLEPIKVYNKSTGRYASRVRFVLPDIDDFNNEIKMNPYEEKIAYNKLIKSPKIQFMYIVIDSESLLDTGEIPKSIKSKKSVEYTLTI